MDQTAQRDFLTGEARPTYNDMLRESIVNMTTAIERQVGFITALAEQFDKDHPTIPCDVSPSGGTLINGPQLVQFMVGNRQVRAFWIMVQNQSTASIYIELNGPASQAGIELTTGQYYEGWHPAIRAVGLFTTAATALNANGGIIVRGLTIPQETR